MYYCGVFMARLSVRLDVSALARDGLTGIGVYTCNLGAGLMRLAEGSNEFDIMGSYRLSRSDRKHFIRQYLPIAIRPELPFYPELLYPGATLYHGTDFRIPNRSFLKKVVTVHDLAVFKPGIHADDFAQRSKQSFRMMLRQGNPDAIITVSQAVGDELADFAPDFRSRIRVIHSGIDHLTIAKREEADPSLGPTFLFLGTLERRKNVVRMIEAFEKVHQRYPHARLILAGQYGNGEREIKHALQMSPASEAITHEGFVSEERKIALYAQATALLYVSLYEGFGLPILEAMRAGLPVITSHQGAQAEVAADAAIKLAPENVDGLAEAMLQLIEKPSLCLAMSHKGTERAKAFTWEQCASQTLAVYKEVSE